MDIQSWYVAHFDTRIEGRYITLSHIQPLLISYPDMVEISLAGTSENGNDIPLLKIGKGEKVVLAWSQMHGNEATTTKAIFDFLKFLCQKDYFQEEIKLFLDSFTFYALPILNPDGAALYTRENANSVDLNRDAQKISQKESGALRMIFDAIKPDLCLNLHDQRSIYGFGSGKPAAVSFLAPAADKERSLTPARKVAMEHIVRMNTALQEYIPGQIGRYDDAFNVNCVGDTFQMAGIPTILFEAGHCNNDYQREQTRSYIFYAFIALFEFFEPPHPSINHLKYFDIPENKTNYKDVIIRNVKLDSKLVSIAIQYAEVLPKNKIEFLPVIDSIGDLDGIYAYQMIDVQGDSILVNSQQNFKIGNEILTIVKEKSQSVIILS